MRKQSQLMIATALCLSFFAQDAKAVPVALHYEATGTTGIYDPNGKIVFSFDLYFDPTLLGSVASNGGLATNGYYTFQPYSYSPTLYGYVPTNESSPFTSVSASVSQIQSYGTVDRSNQRLVTVSAIGENVQAFTGIYINLDGTFAYADYSFGINVYPGDRSHISEDLFVRTSPVPEPSTWGLAIVGFGIAGGALRQRKRVRVSYAA